MAQYTNTSARLLHVISGDGIPPGTTFEVPADQVKALEESSSFRAGYLKRGKVNMPDPVVRPNLEGLSEKDALHVIRFEEDSESLARWGAQESRKPMIDAITGRIAALAAAKDTKDLQKK